MRFVRFFALPAAFVMTMAALPSHAQNLVVNGSFELPQQVNGGYSDYIVGGGGIPGWSIVGTPGTYVTLTDQNFAGNPGYSFPAQDGTQWLDLAGFTDNAPNGVQQSIATTVGDTYVLGFYVGNILGGAYFGTQTQVDAEFSSGGTNFSCVNTAQTASATWRNCGQSFVATNAVTTLTLRSADPANDYAAMIDNVSFVRVADGVSAVPEPESWAMLVMGAGLVGGALRRRQRSSVAALA